MTKLTEADRKRLIQKRERPLASPSDLGDKASQDSFHWHLSGPHFRDYHLLLDEQAEQLFAMTDAIAERVRKLGRGTITSIGHIARLQRIRDNDSSYVEPSDMLAELCEDNRMLTRSMREAHNVCEEHRDFATTSLLEIWIDEAERRTWLLFETGRRGDSSHH